MLTRRSFLQAATATAAVACGRTPSPGDSVPNVVLVFADQLRSMALSRYGQTAIATTVMDRFLEESVTFDLGLSSSPLCVPARTGLLTGQRARTLGMDKNRSAPLPLGTPTLGDWFGEAGYRTGYIGKWHLDDGETEGFTSTPSVYGFEWYYGHNFRHRYLDPIYWSSDAADGFRPNEFAPLHETRVALEKMAEWRHQRFLMVLSWGPPHPAGRSPSLYINDVPQEYFDRVGELALAPNVPASFTDLQGDPDRITANDHNLGYLAASVALDDALDELLQGLQSLSLDQDTLVIFTSDHGEMGGSHGLYRKGHPYAEAVRIPLAFRWPGTLRPRAISVPLTLRDVGTTALSLALGSEAAAISGPLKTVDASGVCWGEEPTETSAYVECASGAKKEFDMVQDERYTLAYLRYTDETLLFDNIEDPYQLTNLADDPDRDGDRVRLDDALLDWQDRLS